MRRSEKVVDMIMQKLAHPDESSLHVFQELADEYAQCCASLNERIRSALSHARMGNNCEAIRQMQMFHIIEDYGNLNFDQRLQWKNICQSIQCTIPETPLEDQAQELFQLIELYRPLQQMLSKHRKMALEHRSFAERLELIYAIASSDPTNDSWSEMIHDLESAQDEEIREIFISTPEGPESERIIMDLYRKLKSPMRRTAPPHELFQQVENVANQFSLNRNIEHLRQEAQLLYQAYSTNDRTNVETMLKRCRDACKQIPSSAVPKDVRKIISDTIAWYEVRKEYDRKQEEFQSQLSGLQAAIVNEESTEEMLTALYSSTEIMANTNNLVIPPEIIDAYNRRIRAIETQKRRRFCLKLTSLLLLTALIVIGSFLVSTHLIHQSKIKKEVLLIVSCLCKYDLSMTPPDTETESDKNGEFSPKQSISDPNALVQARQAYDTFAAENPKLAENQQIQELKVKIEELENQETARKNEFERKRDELSGILDTGKFDENLLVQLENLALIEQEKMDAASLRKRHTDIVNAEIREREEKFSTALSLASTKLKIVSSANDILSEECAQAMEESKSALDELKQLKDSGKVGTELIKSAELLWAQFQTLEGKIEHQKSLSEDAQTITQAVGDLEQFAEAMNAYISKYPDESKTAAYRKVVSFLPSLKPVFQWNAFLEQYGSTFTEWENNSDSLNNIVSNLEQLSSNAAFITDVVSAGWKLEILKKLNTAGGFQGMADSLIAVYNKYNKELWVWYDSEETDQYYYFLEDPRTAHEDTTIPYLINKGGQTKDMGRRKLKESDIDRVRTAPHYDYVSASLKILSDKENTANRDSWNQTVITLCTELNSEKWGNDFDSVLKTILQLETYRVLKNDPVFADLFEDWERIINRSKSIDLSVDWANPDSKDLFRQRIEADDLQKELNRELANRYPSKNLKESLLDISKSGTTQQMEKLGHYQWIGWLDRMNTEWRINCPDNLNLPEGKIWVGVNDPKTAVHFIEIGNCTKGVIKVESDSQELLSGLPIFVRLFDPEN